MVGLGSLDEIHDFSLEIDEAAESNVLHSDDPQRQNPPPNQQLDEASLTLEDLANEFVCFKAVFGCFTAPPPFTLPGPEF